MKPDKRHLSEEQRRAVTFFGKDLCVSAGAGSGKTRVLVERYLWILEKQNGLPKNMLAVTFTDKAANEMKQRLIARCQEMGRPDFRRQLESAWIGTIHSFCARILKEYPIECGLDPDFSVLGAGEAEILAKKTLDRLFDEEASNQTWLDLLKDCGEEKLRTELLDFYDLFRAHGGSSDLLRIDSFIAEGKAHEQKLIDRLQGYLKEKKNEVTPSEASFYETLLTLLNFLKDGSETGWVRFSRFQTFVKELKANSPRIRQAVEELRDLSEIWCLYKAQTLNEPLKREWVSMFLKFKERLEQEKKKISAYDFEDLLFFVYQALSGSSEKELGFQAHLQTLFSYILVDEYQDTSPLQAKIISLLKRSDNLFVVGDVRQSIYGFRHASPDIFIAASRDSENVSLVENYRSRPELLDFVNKFSSRLFVEPYQALKPASVLKFENQKKPVVELIRVPKEEGKSLPECRVLEARTIASRIRDLVDSGERSYRDFAILMKSTTSSQLYEKELQAFSIPYYAHKGRGFYEKMEVADLLNVLEVLENPRDDIALASVLRSPLVQLSEDALFWLAQERTTQKKERFCEALETSAEIENLQEPDREKLDYFKAWIEELRKEKDRLKISEILQRITEKTAYEAKLLTAEAGLQACANVQKFYEIARNLEEKGIIGIEDFVRYLKSLSERELTEPEARILGEAENVVRILTIHAAKGLEFPCVILADMGAKARSNDSPSFCVDLPHGIGSKMKNPVDRQFYQDKTYSEVDEILTLKQREEQSRLFYVAMTRAKELLILSGVPTSTSWMEETMKSWGFEKNDVLPPQIKWETLPITIVPIYRDQSPKKTKARVVLAEGPKIKEIFISGAVSDLEVESAEVEKLKKNLIPVIKPYETLEDLSVTRLLSSDNPIEIEKAEDLPEEELTTPRNEFGTVFHKIMEIAVSHRPRGLWQEKLFSRWMRMLNDSEKLEIRASFEQFWKGEWGEKLRRAKFCYTELPFIFKTRHGILKGQIDLIFQNAGAEWVVVDYKTNRISEEELAVTAESYAWQVAFYALVFKQLYGETPKRGVLYFSTLHRAYEFSYTEKDFAVIAEELENRYRYKVNG